MLSSAINFLLTVFIGNKEGEACGMKVTAHSTAKDVVEFVSTTKALPQKNYALYLVVGDSESGKCLWSHALVKSMAI